MSSNPEAVAEVILAAGGGAFFTEVARRLFGRKRAKIDAAAVVQTAALALITPLENQMEKANQKAEALDLKLHEIEAYMDELLRWARNAKALLDDHRLSVAPIPTLVPIRRVQ